MRSVPQIRKLDFLTLFTAGFNIYRAKFASLALFYLLLYFPSMIFVANFASVLFRIQSAGTLPSLEESLTILLWGGLLLIYSLILYPFALLVPARMAGCLYLGKDVGLRECVRFAREHWMLAQLSYGIFGLGIILIFIVPLLSSLLIMVRPLMVLGILLTFATLLIGVLVAMFLVILMAPMNGVISFEDQRTGKAFQQAVKNARRTLILSLKNFWYLLGILILTWILLGIIRNVTAYSVNFWLEFLPPFLTGKVASVTDFLGYLQNPPQWVQISTLIVGVVVSTITLPFEQIVISLLYFDLRSRAEALDIFANLALLKGEDALSAIARAHL